MKFCIATTDHLESICKITVEAKAQLKAMGGLINGKTNILQKKYGSKILKTKGHTLPLILKAMMLWGLSRFLPHKMLPMIQ